jgi:hypothetical protein
MVQALSCFENFYSGEGYYARRRILPRIHAVKNRGLGIEYGFLTNQSVLNAKVSTGAKNAKS